MIRKTFSLTRHRLLQGNIICVHVGPKRKCYKVHQAVLEAHGLFKERIYSTGNQTHPTGAMTPCLYIDYEPTLFEMLIQWLYRGTLPAVNMDDESIAKHQVTNLVNLYLKAQVLAMPALLDAIIDRLRARETCRLGWFPSNLIKLIYQSSGTHLPLRRYIVNSFLYKTSQWVDDDDDDDDSLDEALRDQLDAGNTEFVRECYIALYKKCKNIVFEDPNKEPERTYHHGE